MGAVIGWNVPPAVFSSAVQEKHQEPIGEPGGRAAESPAVASLLKSGIHVAALSHAF